MSVLFTPGEINGLSLANRIVRSATWEGPVREIGTIARAFAEAAARPSSAMGRR
jgi:2,4-dienoyl-CoA reductase-like NADH-dependent reductase (Old Yellow Enzyme family)